MVFPSGAAGADIDSIGIVLINGFVCFLLLRSIKLNPSHCDYI